MSVSERKTSGDPRVQGETTVHFAFELDGPVYQRGVPNFPFSRNGFRFNEETSHDGNGWVVVTSFPRAPLQTTVPRARRIFVVGESSHAQFSTEFLNQFGVLISPFRPAGYKWNWYQSHPGLPWFFGTKHTGKNLLPTLSYQELANLPVPEKKNAVSAVLSTKTLHPGHRKRLRFLQVLKDQLGDRLSVFGRGIRSVNGSTESVGWVTKTDAVLPFAFHLSLENTIEPHYWTEKLPDALLGYALPIYSGCDEIKKILPAGSFEAVNIDRPEEAAVLIADLLDKNVWQERLPMIKAARRRIMEQETIFDVVTRAIQHFPDNTPALATVDQVSPPKALRLWQRISREFTRTYHKLTFRATDRLKQN